ncbi:MAG: transglutaminase N-terminal domain-containing protein, partial [Myxococcota bacterium]
MLEIFHETTYRYARPVERSSHRLRLRPLVDAEQDLVDWKLDLSVDGERWEYEDVFGNHVTALEVTTPFQELVVRGHSVVRVHVGEPEPLRTAPGRDQLPLAWMPWQRQMMLPYLLPPELPESELMTLRDFAVGFALR